MPFLLSLYFQPLSSPLKPQSQKTTQASTPPSLPTCVAAMSPYHGIILLPHPWTWAATPPSSSVNPESEPKNRERESILCLVIVPHPDRWLLDLPKELWWLPSSLNITSEQCMDSILVLSEILGKNYLILLGMPWESKYVYLFPFSKLVCHGNRRCKAGWLCCWPVMVTKICSFGS